MKKIAFLGRSLAAVAAMLCLIFPALAGTTLRAVMHSDLKILDPIWTTAYITPQSRLPCAQWSAPITSASRRRSPGSTALSRRRGAGAFRLPAGARGVHERAVQTGLALIEAVHRLASPRPPQPYLNRRRRGGSETELLPNLSYVNKRRTSFGLIGRRTGWLRSHV